MSMQSQSGDVTHKKCPSCLVETSISLPNTLTHTLTPPLSVPPAWRYIRACVGVIVERHCRNLAAAMVWRGAPTLSPIQRPARCEVGKFQSAIQLNGPHKSDYKPQRIPVGTWERRRCEGGPHQRSDKNGGQCWAHTKPATPREPGEEGGERKE